MIIPNPETKSSLDLNAAISDLMKWSDFESWLQTENNMLEKMFQEHMCTSAEQEKTTPKMWTKFLTAVQMYGTSDLFTKTSKVAVGKAFDSLQDTINLLIGSLLWKLANDIIAASAESYVRPPTASHVEEPTPSTSSLTFNALNAEQTTLSPTMPDEGRAMPLRLNTGITIILLTALCLTEHSTHNCL
jgi:hypothetical protein